MNRSFRVWTRAARRFACMAAACAVLTPAQAAGWPDAQHPLHVVVAFPPGGGADALARAVQPDLAKVLGTNVIVDNRPGAGGIIGTDYVAKADPDGYTVYIATPGTFTIWPNLRKLPFDPVKDFAPISVMVTMPNLLVTGPNASFKSVKELIGDARANKQVIHYASGGVGTIGQMAAEELNLKAGIHMVQVPYKGTAPALTDVMSGVVQLTFSDPAAKALLASGKLKLLAVTTAHRSAQFPDTPTIAEEGVPGYEVQNWYGMVAPAKTPPDVIATLNAALVKVMAMPDVKKRLAVYGMAPTSSTSTQFADLMEHERARWGALIKQANIKAQ
jgi:tripartite-type tricarboxylate transporter receptor subunit TctC